MKIQCSCGAKVSFDITPEMLRSPVNFVCPQCGVDSSELVNQLIRQQFGTASATPLLPAGAPATPPPPSGRSAPLKVSSPASASESEAPSPEGAPQPCVKHRDQWTTHRCVICQKPMCPVCMEIFGYVCSAHCKGKAEAQRITVPIYEQQKSAVETRLWRKVGRITVAATAVIVLLVGAWIWYAWFGSMPKPAFSIRFSEAAYSGQVRMCPQNQVIYLRGGTLARHDMRAQKQIWSRELIDKRRIADVAAASLEQMKVAREKALDHGADRDDVRLPQLTDLIRNMERSAAAALKLHVRGENVWLSSPGLLARYDWQTGHPSREIPLDNGFQELVPDGDDLLVFSEQENGAHVIKRISLLTGESRQEEIAAAPPTPTPEPATAVAGKSGPTASGRPPSGKPAPSGRPAGTPVAKAGTNQAATRVASATSGRPRPIDPAALAARVQNMSMPSRLALPAVVAANANQQRLMAELRGQPENTRPVAIQPETFEHASLLRSGNSFVRFSVKLLESKFIEHEAMKAPPKKSALEGTVNAAATGAIANEILNEIQRDRVGGKIQEDVSRYEVTLGRPDSKEVPWTGEVIGPPRLFPQQSVDVLAAGKSLLIFDKMNRKLWESKLSFNLAAGLADEPGDEESVSGQRPCQERGDTLYVFDLGVLTAFELRNGNARWRLPTVGVSGLHFDDRGMMYVNTTTASPDNVKFSRQIDISDKIRKVILKVDPKTGKTLWKNEAEGTVSHISGKFIYTTESYAGDDDGDGGHMANIKMTAAVPPHIRIKRLNPSNGEVMWEHYQKRAPLDVRFEKNTIQLLFKKELQILKFLSL